MVMVMRRKSLEMDPLSFNQHGFMTGDHIIDHHQANLYSIYPNSGDLSSSSESDLVEDGSSSGSSSPAASPKTQNGPLADMSSLLEQLPFKRGLSKHYQGKSQSFTSLSNVTCLEDLAKPDNPYNKKLKSCQSYMGLSDATMQIGSGQPTKLITKKSSRGSCSSLSSKRNGNFMGNAITMRPPHPPHRSNSRASFPNQAPLFA